MKTKLFASLAFFLVAGLGVFVFHSSQTSAPEHTPQEHVIEALEEEGEDAQVADSNSQERVVEISPEEETENTPIPELVTAPQDDQIPTDNSDMPENETTPEAEAKTPTCFLLDGFDGETTNTRWGIINDNVMGGLSLGNFAIDDRVMTFAGSINTNGGGFSSLRSPLPPNILDGSTYALVRGRSDGRDYNLTFRQSRSRSISYRTSLRFAGSGEWEDAIVLFDELKPHYFGQRVPARAFDPNAATEIGIILSDGQDGAFSLEIDSIEICEE